MNALLTIVCMLVLAGLIVIVAKTLTEMRRDLRDWDEV
jgi:hypothetical protein